METQPPANQDAAHLRVLAIFHHVFGVLALGLLGLFSLQIYWITNAVTTFHKTDFLQSDGSDHAFRSTGPHINTTPVLFASIFLIIIALLLFYSGRSLQKHVNRTYSMIIAGCLCPLFPLGTVLGVFTLIVLCRDSVVRLYHPGPP